MKCQGQASSSSTSYDVTDDDGGVDQARAKMKTLQPPSAEPRPQVHVLHSTDCYDKYMEFIDKAAAAACENPGKIKLYIASAPPLDDRLYDILYHVGRQGKEVRYKQFNFFFRKDEFNKVLKNQKKTREFFANNIRKGIVQVYVSSNPEYFHTKWAADTEPQTDTEQLMLTSANVIESHLNTGIENSMIINSLILHHQGTNLFKRDILSPQLKQCAEFCVSIDQSNGPCNYVGINEIGAEQGGHVETVKDLTRERIFSKVKNFINDALETMGDEQGGQEETVANLSKKRVYSEVKKFMNDVFETIRQNDQDGHSIHIFSPYIECNVMRPFLE